MTNTPWFGTPRDDWEYRRLKHAVKLIDDRADDISEEVPYVGLEDVKPELGELNNPDSLFSEENSNSRSTAGLFREGDVLLNKLRPYLAKAFVAPQIGACTTEFLILRPGPDLIPEFLLYTLISPNFVARVDSTTYGAKMPRAGWTQIGAIYIPLPPISVQHEIVEYLDHATQEVDQLIQTKKTLIEELKEKRRSLIARAVTRGLEKVSLQDSGYPWLGKIPAHWNVERLKFHLHSIEQGWSPSCYSYPAPEDKWGVLKVGAVNDWIFDPSENKQLPEDTEPRPELEIEEGDILMSRANTTELLGSVSIVQSTRDKLLLCDKLYRLDLKDGRFDTEFLVRFLRSDPGRFEFERAATGTSGSMQNITQETVQNVWVVRPPLDEQRDIVEFINERAEQINRVREGTQKTIDLLEERRRSLITAAVTGQLDLGVPA